MQYVLCKTAQNHFAIPIDQVKELVPFTHIEFRFPKAPQNILGGVLLRGNTVVVIQADECTPPNKGILVVNTNRQSILMEEQVSIDTCNDEISEFGTLTINNRVYAVFNLSPEAIAENATVKKYSINPPVAA